MLILNKGLWLLEQWKSGGFSLLGVMPVFSAALVQF